MNRRETDLYEKGDYSFWSRVFEPGSAALTEAVGIAERHLVLDAAAGNGNTSLEAVRRRATVTALDISRAQIEKGRARARREGQSIAWVEADARRVPFADETFDRCLNSFGDVIAAQEMLRVARPGGAIGITEWTGEGFAGELGELQASLETRKQVPDLHVHWGREDEVLRALAPQTQNVALHRHVIHARFESVDWFCSELPKVDTDLDHEHLSLEQRKLFGDELRRLAVEWNRADDGSLLLEMDYLLTVAIKPVS